MIQSINNKKIKEYAKLIQKKKEIRQIYGSLTLAHSQNSQMSFMYGFFFVKFLFFYSCMCCNCDIIVVKDGCFYETVL